MTTATKNVAYYVSGPMRGYDNYNFEAFIAAEDELAQQVAFGGDKILNPARNFDGDQSRTMYEYMQRDMEQVLEADVIVLLDGWEESEGANREVALATWTGKTFMRASVLEGEWHFWPIDTPTPNGSKRAEVLTGALQAVTGDRNNQYGPPTQDFMRTAALWTALGFSFNGQPVVGHNVAQAQMLLKLSRSVWSPKKLDHALDIAGYAACGYEAAMEEGA
jgi:hypothetical protein